MPRHTRPAASIAVTTVTTVATTVATTAALCLGTLTAAHADDTPPPVTTDDAVTIEGRSNDFAGVSFVDVLRNDRAAGGGTEGLEICRLEAPRRGLSVAEVQANGAFTIQSPRGGVSSLSNAPAEEGALESIVLLPWANRAGTYRFTYWACDTEHLTPATVTVTVRKTPDVTAQATERPGRVRFTNPRRSRVVVLYGGLREDRPDGRFGLAPRSGETRRVERSVIQWVAVSPRTGEVVNRGKVSGLQAAPPASASSATTSAQGDRRGRVTPRMLRAWRSR